MQISFSTDDFAVVDDVLEKDEFEEIWKYVIAQRYKNLLADEWSGGWRLEDGPVMQGVCSFYGDYERGQVKFPTGLAIDLLFQKIMNANPELQKWIGKKDFDWDTMTGTPMLYPRNSGLYWHRDAPNWTGSYTFYCHPEWNVQWGGELFLAEVDQEIPEDWGPYFAKPRSLKGLDGKFSFGAALDDRDANEAILKKGIGKFVMPKPNRLAIIRQGTPHTVSRIHESAGDKVRASISGFFLKPKQQRV